MFIVFAFNVVVWATGPFVDKYKSLPIFYTFDTSLGINGSNVGFFFDKQRIPIPTKRLIKQSTIPMKDILLDFIGMQINLFCAL